MSEYEQALLKIEQGRNRIEILKILATPLTILVTVWVAFVQVEAAQKREMARTETQHEINMSQYEMSLIGMMGNAENPCLMRKVLVGMYEHHLDESNKQNRQYRWYQNFKTVLAEACEGEAEEHQTLSKALSPSHRGG